MPSINLFLHVFINTAMVMGLIPAVGVPPPLISYTGTAMMTVLLGFGLMMSVYIHRDLRAGAYWRWRDDEERHPRLRQWRCTPTWIGPIV